MYLFSELVNLFPLKGFYSKFLYLSLCSKDLYNNKMQNSWEKSIWNEKQKFRFTEDGHTIRILHFRTLGKFLLFRNVQFTTTKRWKHCFTKTILFLYVLKTTHSLHSSTELPVSFRLNNKLSFLPQSLLSPSQLPLLSPDSFSTSNLCLLEFVETLPIHFIKLLGS